MSGAVREYTTYFDFEIPSFDFPGWHTYYDRNIKTMDSILYLMTGTDSLKGTWKNATAYNIGDRVVDIQVSFAYECFVAHTSATAPTTFAQDRASHPSYWHAVDFIQALSGSSITPVTIELGTKVFATQTGRIFIAGAKVIITSASNPNVNYMWGSVLSYTGSTLTVDVDVISGSGTHSDWLISVSGERGAQGIQGEIGLQGPQGEVGPEGPDGPIGPQGIIEEAPTSGSVYGRNGLTADWEVVSSTAASTLPVTPAGGISATNVQSAIYELDTEKLAKAGGTMTGLLVLSGNPVDALGAATKQYADLGGGDKVFRAGDTMTGALTVTPKGSTFGGAGGTGATGAVTTADANILLYNYSSVNWSGIGADASGNMWFKAGFSGSPAPRLYLDAASGEATFTNKVNINSGGLACVGQGTFVNDVRTYRSANNATGCYYFSASGDKFLHYDGTNFHLNGGSLYTGALTTQGNSLTAGAISGATLSVTNATIGSSLATPSISTSVITASGSDGLSVNTTGHARVATTVSGVRAWSTGVTNFDGNWGVWDDTAGTRRLVIRTDGTSNFSGNVEIPQTLTATGRVNVEGSYGGMSTESLGHKLEIKSSGAGQAAILAFHIPGQFAGGLGIDADSHLKVGGWSFGATAHKIFHEGNSIHSNLGRWANFVNGLQMRWGTVAGGADYFVSFGNAFSTTCTAVVVSCSEGQGPAGGQTYVGSASGWNNTGFVIYPRYLSGGTSFVAGQNFAYVAFGY